LLIPNFKNNTLLTDWFQSFKKYFIGYTAGYFELPFVANSPSLMYKELIKMPFVKDLGNGSSISMNTPFIKGTQHFIQLESGLWFTCIEAHFKVNICAVPVYIPATDPSFFSLYFYINKNQIPSTQINIKNVSVDTKSWTLHAPGTKFKGYIDKNTEGTFYCFYFDRDWAKLNLNFENLISNNEFFKKEEGSYIINDFVGNELFNLTEFEFVLKDFLKDQNHLLKIKMMVYSFISQFVDHIKNKKPSNDSKKIRNLTKVQNLLLQNLTANFPGLKQLSHNANLSVSSLKNNFKEQYGVSIFQYYKTHQMELAKKLITQNPSISIKELALLFGYENTSKFSAAFKRQHQHNPSEVNR
jgi:AraC-like DNA-binding protein